MSLPDSDDGLVDETFDHKCCSCKQRRLQDRRRVARERWKRRRAQPAEEADPAQEAAPDPTDARTEGTGGVGGSGGPGAWPTRGMERTRCGCCRDGTASNQQRHDDPNKPAKEFVHQQDQEQEQKQEKYVTLGADSVDSERVQVHPPSGPETRAQKEIVRTPTIILQEECEKQDPATPIGVPSISEHKDGVWWHQLMGCLCLTRSGRGKTYREGQRLQGLA